jgi:hypothetical protein
MEDYEEKADELEQAADRLGEQSEQVGDEIGDARSDLESKLGDTQAPGLLDEEGAAPGGTGISEDDNDEEAHSS